MISVSKVKLHTITHYGKVYMYDMRDNSVEEVTDDTLTLLRELGVAFDELDRIKFYQIMKSKDKLTGKSAVSCDIEKGEVVFVETDIKEEDWTMPVYVDRLSSDSLMTLNVENCKIKSLLPYELDCSTFFKNMSVNKCFDTSEFDFSLTKDVAYTYSSMTLDKLVVNLNFPNARTVTSMFLFSYIKQLEITEFNLPEAESAENLFDGLSTESVSFNDITFPKVSEVTSMFSLKVNRIALRNLKFPKVTMLYSIFSGLTVLETGVLALVLEGIEFPNATSVYRLFESADIRAFTVDLRGIRIGKAGSSVIEDATFRGATFSSLTPYPIDTTGVKSYLFDRCSINGVLDLCGWLDKADLGHITFENCFLDARINVVDIRTWSVELVKKVLDCGLYLFDGEIKVIYVGTEDVKNLLYSVFVGDVEMPKIVIK